MKRKEYETPTMLVVELKGQLQLLSGSGDSYININENYESDPNNPDPINPN